MKAGILLFSYFQYASTSICRFEIIRRKIMEEKRNVFNSQYLFQTQNNKKKQTQLSNFYAIGTILYFLNFSDIFHMTSTGITSIIVCSTEWGKFEI